MGPKTGAATDYRNYSPVQGQPIPGDRSLPDYNGVNVYGDESEYFNTKAQMTIHSKLFAGHRPQKTFVWHKLQANCLIIHGVTRTGYNENTLTDYKAYNFKASAGFYYKFSDNVTASMTGNFGKTNTIYTGTDRYNLQAVQIGQYKAEVTGKNFYVRAYTTQENAGSSSDMVVTADYINEAYAPTKTVWAPTYMAIIYSFLPGAVLQGLPDNQAYAFASQQPGILPIRTDSNPAQPAFNNALNTIKKTPIPKGGEFIDRTNLYAGKPCTIFLI